MPPSKVPRSGNRLLGLFGFETGRKAADTALWAAPYLLALAAGLASISALTYSFLGIPIWAYLVAGILALLHCFLFLAWIRKRDADSDGGEG